MGIWKDAASFQHLSRIFTPKLVFLFKISNTWIYSPTACPIGSVLLLKRTQLTAISYLKQQPFEKVCIMSERLTLKYRVNPYRHIFVYLYSGCTVVASVRTMWKNVKKYAAAMNK